MKLLDCTMRDGGYVNNWNFSDDFAINCYNSLIESGFDFIELGFINLRDIYNNDICGKWRSIQNDYLKFTHGKVCIMIDYSNSNIDLIPNKINSSIDMIRVAFHKYDLENALKLCKKIKKKGYIVCANAMATFNYHDHELELLCKLVSDYNIDYVYIADSYGSLIPDDIDNIYHKLVHYFKSYNPLFQYKIGIHLHNNKQNAFANALHCIKLNFDIIDSTILGMGRGAGNLCSELLLSHLNGNILPILKFADNYVKPLLNKYNNWGYNLPYLISAHFQCHPNYISKLNDYNINDIEQIWNIIKDIYDNGFNNYFHKDYLDKIIYKYV
jgi:4-hydroxy 2-oxovalerate aldolase